MAGKTATITGDYIATKNAKTEIDFGSKLIVLGTTKLNETTINLKSNSYPGKKEVKELITSNKFEGDINKLHINVDGMRNANISKNNDKIMVEMSRESAISYLGTKEESSINTAKNIENVLQELDVKIENNSANEKDLLLGKSIVEMSTSQFDNATKKMSGEIYASAQSLTFAQAENINKNLSNHLSSLEDFKNSNYEWQGWMSGILTHGKLQQSGYASAKTKMQGGQFGIDKKINPTTQLGLSFSYSYANADFNQYAGNSKSDGIGTSIYGKKYLNDNYYLLGRVGVSKFSTRVKRELLDAKLNTVQGDIKHHDTMISSYIEIGKHFNYFTPFIGYSYDYLKRGSFNEGNAEWGIQAKSKDYFKSNILLGLRGEYKVDSYKFTSYVSHSINVGNRNLDFTGNFTGSTINQTFKGIKQVKNTTWVGFEISKEISPQFTINGNFDMRFEENKKSDSIVSLGLDYRF